MADRNHIRPAIVRGSLVHQVGDVQFAEFKYAACAWSAAQALQDQRTAALAEMKAAAHDMAAFSAAAKREADLAAQIRRLRRAGGAT